MNDLPWIKYKPREMFLDTVGMTADGERAHRRLCDYVWYNDKPPAKDDKVLRSITQTEPQNWGRVKLELIGKGWFECPTAFLHKQAIESLNEAKITHVSKHNQTAKANKLPLLRLLPPDAATGVVSYEEIPEPSVKPPVTSTVTSDVTLTQEQEQIQSQEPKKNKLSFSMPVSGVAGGGEPPRANASPRRDAENQLSTLNLQLTIGTIGAVVAHIMGNRDGWDYDNSRVKVNQFTARSLRTVLETFIDRIEGARRVTGREAATAWQAACGLADETAKLGQIKDTLPGWCMAEWKRQLATLAAAKTPNEKS